MFYPVLPKQSARGKPEKAREFGIQALYFVVIMGIGMGIIMVGISPFLPKWLGADQKIHTDASLYFGIICAPMLFRASSMILGAVMRGAGDTKSPMIANLFMNLTNVIFNFFLIYESRTVTLGSFSFYLPSAGLGVTGAAIATAISYVVGGIFMLIVYYRNPSLSPNLLQSLQNRLSIFRDTVCMRLPPLWREMHWEKAIRKSLPM